MAAGLALLAVVVRGVPAALFYGTSDVYAWSVLGQQLLAGQNFYATGLHNWPPLWIYLAAAAWVVHGLSGLPFSFLVKLPPIGADACLAVLLYRAGLSWGWGARGALGAGLAYALNPVSILVSGYHGQFDSLMVASAFLACYGFEAWRGRWRLVGSGLAMGLGVWFKAVPLLLLPVVLPRLATWRERLLYAALAVGPAVLGTLPYLILWPTDVVDNFLRYSSWFGQWGYPVLWLALDGGATALVQHTLPDPAAVLQGLWPVYAVNTWIVLAALVPTWWITFRRGLDVFSSVVATFVVFSFVTVGFGLQYLVWVVPFAVAARDRWLWAYSVAASGAMLVAYTLGADAYLPLALHWPAPQRQVGEFVAQVATLPVWLFCGRWALDSLCGTRRSSQGSIERERAARQAIRRGLGGL